MKTLPNNLFGQLIMLALILLIFIFPTTLVFWLVCLIAPWWVAVPASLLAGLVAVISTVKFKG